MIDVLIILVLVIVLQCISIHNIVHFKYMQLYVSITPQ